MATEKDATEEAQINEIVKSYTSRNRFSEREIQTILHDADAWQIRGFVFAGFQEGIQSRTKQILELIQAGIRDRKQLYKVSVIDQFTDGGYIMALESLLKALRDKVVVEK